ncbi:MAG: IS1634 family transposase [Magnetococcus sp. DMHC-6]
MTAFWECTPSKLATFRSWENNTIRETFNLEDANKDELFSALDWLLERQPAIEKRLVKRHISDGDLILYDLTSTYLEGHKCPLAHHGYSRDHRGDRMQIEFGLVTDREGRPVSVEVFEGNTSDPMTLGAQIIKLKEKFGLKNIIVVGDRGMVTTTRIKEDLLPNGFSWITALRHDSIRRLAEGPLQMGLFDDQNFAEIESPDYPGERLVACRNPNLAEEMTRKRKDLLNLTESGLFAIQEAIKKGRLRDCGTIGRKVESVLKKHHMQRFFKIEIAQGSFSFSRIEERISQATDLDGIYVLRSSVPKETMDAAETVRSYKSLSNVERAFHTIKTDLDVRPIFHYLADRVRAHIFLCMLAYYVEWEMRRKLAPLLFTDEERKKNKADPVTSSKPSKEGLRKTGTLTTKSGLPLHDFSSLLKNLAPFTKRGLSTPGNPHLKNPTQ